MRPWLILNSPSAAWRTCFVGSGEIYRMYAYDKEYYERYWAKLMKYMAAKRNVKASARAHAGQQGSDFWNTHPCSGSNSEQQFQAIPA